MLFKPGDRVKATISCTGTVPNKTYIVKSDYTIANGCSCDNTWRLIHKKSTMAKATKQTLQKVFKQAQTNVPAWVIFPQPKIFFTKDEAEEYCSNEDIEPKEIKKVSVKIDEVK